MTIPGSSCVDTPVYSDMRGDPDFSELLEMFVGEMATRRSELREAHTRGDLERVRTMAHQLKGAGGGYGFSGLTEVAAALEQACKASDATAILDRLAQTEAYLSRLSV